MKKTKITEDLGEKRFKALIENSHEGIVIYDKSGKIKYATPSIKKISGFEVKDVIGKLSKDFIHNDFIEETRRVFKDLFLKPGNHVTLVQRLLHKKGHYYWAESVLTNSLHIPGIDGIVSNFRDITEKRLADEKVNQTQGLLETINKNLSQGVYMAIIGKGYLYVNDAFLNIFGYKSWQEVKKLKPADFFANESERKQIVKSIQDNASIKEAEVEFVRKNGEKFWGILNATLINEKGKENHFVGSIRDISKEKVAAQALIESRNFLNSIINTVAAPLFVKDEKHRWIMFNEPFCKLIGRTREEMLGKTDRAFLPKAEVKVFWNADKEVLETGSVIIQEESLTSNGEKHDLLTVKSRSINEKGEKFIIGFITDVTALRKVMQEINQLNANLQGVMESTSESIFAIDRNYCYTSFNKNHERIMKLLYGVDIKVGMSKLECVKGSRDEKWLTSELQLAMRGNHFVSEKKLDYPQYRDKHIQLTYNPIQNEKGLVQGVAIFLSDITTRKHTEARLNALNQELVDQNWQLATQEEELKIALDELSKRNFELDQLMYKTSHDLRAPLSSIMGLINLTRLDHSEGVHALYINKIEDRINKLDEFISSMLNYARANRAEITIKKIDLEALALKCIQELEYLDNFKAVRTEIKVKDNGIDFKGDLLRVTIVFSNIISNAYKYCNTEAKSYLKLNIVITPLTATIEFKDNGIGIREKYQDKIYNMFYRATERSQGSGLGMYIVKQAIEKMEGSIKLKSIHGKGTSIKITLPNK